MDFLNSFGLSLVAFVFVLGVLIFIHELGHYLAAKYLGIGVEVFSLGFGKRLFGFRRGQTDYRISVIPLGGYVKMTGENPDEELSGGPEEFLSRPKKQRFLVAVAGPLMNIVLAIVLLALNSMIGTQIFAYLDEQPLIGAVEDDSPAARIGLQVGDVITKIDGERIETWRDAEFKIRTSPDILLDLEAERNGNPIRVQVIPEAESEAGAGRIGVSPLIPYRIARTSPGSPAEKAGLQPGDLVLNLKTDGGEVTGFWGIRQAVAKAGIQPLTFDVERGGTIFELTVTPELMDGSPVIGAFVEFESKIRQFGPIQALENSLEENYRLTALTFVTVGRIISGQASVKQMSGPIEIARYSGMAAALGFGPLLGFMALVSLQLGILNLMPIPILDGGVITLLAVEGILGHDLSLRVKERIFQVGFIFLVLLMCVVIFNDISKNLPTF